MIDNTIMKQALRFKSVYFVSILLTIFGIGLPFFIWGMVYLNSGARDFPYHMTMLIVGISLFLLGLIIGDIPLIIFKMRTTEIDPEIPEDLPIKMWRLRWPFYISGLLTLTSIGIIGIIFLVTKSWPLF